MFPKKFREKKENLLLAPHHLILFPRSSLLTIAIGWESNDINTLEKKKGTKLSIFGNDRFLHLENLQKSSKKLIYKSIKLSVCVPNRNIMKKLHYPFSITKIFKNYLNKKCQLFVYRKLQNYFVVKIQT